MNLIANLCDRPTQHLHLFLFLFYFCLNFRHIINQRMETMKEAECCGGGVSLIVCLCGVCFCLAFIYL